MRCRKPLENSTICVYGGGGAGSEKKQTVYQEAQISLRGTTMRVREGTFDDEIKVKQIIDKNSQN